MIKRISTKDGHVYGDKRVPGVTSIIAVANNPGLNFWRGKEGNQEADRISKEAADLGQEVHDMTQDYLLKHITNAGVPFSMNPVAIKLFFQAKAWIDANVKEVLAVEEKMEGKEYGGTLDLRCILKKDNAHAIVDWKTSKQCNPQMGWQLSALQNLCEKTYSLTGIPIDKLLIVRLKKKEKELANPKTKAQVKEYPYDMTAFNACLTLYTEMNGGK